MLGTCRLILAILVALSHADVRVFGLNPGVMAVVCFYLISGYVMTGLLRRHYVGIAKIPAFYADRVMRLFPQYLVIAMLTLCLFYITGKFTNFLQHPPVFQDIINNVIVVPLNYFMFNTSGSFTLIPPAWSLGAEIQFYLIMPFLMWFRIRWLTFLLGTIIFILAALTFINSDTYGYRLLPGVLVFFLIGSKMHDLHENNKHLWKFSRLVFALSIVAIACLYWLGKHTAPYNLETLLGLGIGVPLLAWLAPMKQNKIDNWLGDLSYGVFLNHFLLQWFVVGVPKTITEFTIYLILSIVLSMVTQRWAERPILQLRKKLRVKKEFVKQQ
jgi:peptidoglycan/LPS O-acetylase OafA/YrhL